MDSIDNNHNNNNGDNDYSILQNDDDNINNPITTNREDVIEEVVVLDQRVLWFNRSMKIFLSPIELSDEDFNQYIKKIEFIGGFPIVLITDNNSSVMKLIGCEDSNVASIDLDLVTSISKIKTTESYDIDNNNNNNNNNDDNNNNDNDDKKVFGIYHVMYNYCRKGEPFALNVIFSIEKGNNDDQKGIRDTLTEVEFIFKQFTLWTFEDDTSDSSQLKAHEDSRKPNQVARGLEKTGVYLREGLKAGGKSTGIYCIHYHYHYYHHHYYHHHYYR